MSASYPIPIRRDSLTVHDGCNAYYLYGRSIDNREICVACLGADTDEDCNAPVAADFTDANSQAAYGFRLVDNRVADILAFRIQMLDAQYEALHWLKSAKRRPL